MIVHPKCFFFLLLSVAIPGAAQVSTATLTGFVVDSSKASLPNAKLKLINTQTGSENDSVTDSGGGFLLPGIIPGAYTLQIERTGFAIMQVNGITLNVGDTKSLLIRMKVGSVTESVRVDASGLTLNTTDASVSTVIDRKFVGTVPLNGRSFQDLISMTPGIVTQNPQAAGQEGNTQGDFSVNGQQPQSNSFLVDGVSANIDSGLVQGASRLVGTGSAAGSTALGTTQSLVPLDALQEFRVLSSTYSAEYGRTPGGQFSFLTRSGTNGLHGSVYLYFRNSDLDANDWFTVHQFFLPASYSQNDFGATLGGPIIFPKLYNGRDRSFFFLSYEGLYLSQPTPQIFAYVPSYEIQSEAPGGLMPVLETFPYSSNQEIVGPTGDPTGLAPILINGYALPSNVDATSFRADHIFSPKLSGFFRFGDTPSFSQTRQLYSFTANHIHTRTFTLGFTDQISTAMSNELRAGYAENNSSVNTITRLDIAYGNPNLNTAIGIPNSYSPVSSEVYIRVAGAGDTRSSTDQASGSLHQWNIRDTFSLQAGRHLLKFGIDQLHSASGLNPPALSVEADFFDRASMANNLASDVVVTRSQPASPILNEFSAFSEDEWKVSSSVNMSLGLRWEVDPAPTGRNGKDAYTVLGDINQPTTLSLAHRGTPLWQTTWHNFAPRLGAAWIADATPDRELVVRLGGGIFFDTATQAALAAFNGIGFASSDHFEETPLPLTLSQLEVPATVAPPYSNATAFAFPSHLQLPYSFQWNVSLEKSLDRNQVLTMSYVAASGHRLLQEQRMNVSQLNPNFGDVYYFPGRLTSNYQSLQAKFQRTMAHGFQALASYTWAHLLDYGSTDPAFPLTRGNSDLDVRQNLEGAISWDLPKPHGNMFVREMLGDWSLDGRLLARTAFPVNLSGNMFFDAVTGSTYYSGVDLVPNRPLYLHSSNLPGGRMFNGGPGEPDGAFSLPEGTAQGDAPRNLLRGFDAVQMNLAARRTFHIHDAMNLYFGTEIFNLLNHPVFGYIDPYLTDALFGQSTKMLCQSFGATGSLYQQGGPRSVQFEFRFNF